MIFFLKKMLATLAEKTNSVDIEIGSGEGIRYDDQSNKLNKW